MQGSRRRLKIDRFDQLTNAQGWITDGARAQALGISASHMSQIRAGTKRPGAKFIAGALEALNVGIRELFERDDQEQKEEG